MGVPPRDEKKPGTAESNLDRAGLNWKPESKSLRLESIPTRTGPNRSETAGLISRQFGRLNMRKSRLTACTRTVRSQPVTAARKSQWGARGTICFSSRSVIIRGWKNHSDPRLARPVRPMPPIVVTGAAGQLGRALCAEFGSAALGLTRADLDLSRPDELKSQLLRLSPAVVVNSAAYTEVDRAEADEELCFRINSVAVEALADACRQMGAVLVQISTDYVFDGSVTRVTPFTEADEPCPQGVYARSKLAGERAAATAPRHLIVRTCGLYGVGGRNFVETMLRLGAERRVLRVVDDQTCSPSYAAHVASAIAALLRGNAQGIFHIANAGAVTWHDFAAEIFRQAGLPVKLMRISAAEYGAAALDRPTACWTPRATSAWQARRCRTGGGPWPSTWSPERRASELRCAPSRSSELRCLGERQALLILDREQRLGDRPVDGQLRIIPAQGALKCRLVKVAALVDHVSLGREHTKAVRDARG